MTFPSGSYLILLAAISASVNLLLAAFFDGANGRFFTRGTEAAVEAAVVVVLEPAVEGRGGLA